MLAVRCLIRVLRIGTTRKVALSKSAYKHCASMEPGSAWYARRFTGSATDSGDVKAITGYELFYNVFKITEDNLAQLGKDMPSGYQTSELSYGRALAEFKTLPKKQQASRVLNACVNALKTDGLDKSTVQHTATRFAELTGQLEVFVAKVLPADVANVSAGLEKLVTSTDIVMAKQALSELRVLFVNLIDRIEQLERDVASLKQDNVSLKQDIISLKQDNVSLKQDIISLKQVTAGLMESVSVLELRRFIERARFEVVEQLRIEHVTLGNRLARKTTKDGKMRRIPARLSDWLAFGSEVEREAVRRSVYAIVQQKYDLAEHEWELLNRVFCGQLSTGIHTVGKLPTVDMAMKYVDAFVPYQDVDESDVRIVKAMRKLVIRLAETERSPKPKSG